MTKTDRVEIIPFTYDVDELGVPSQSRTAHHVFPKAAY